jgi:serine/threonine-protein kinase
LNRIFKAMSWTVLGVGLFVAVFTLSFYVAMQRRMQSTEVRIPDLDGLTLDEAQARVDKLGLRLQVVDQRNDPRVASGGILEQAPPPGATVRRGRKINLILSLGGKVLRVPDLTGQAVRAAAVELRRAGFTMGEETYVYSSRFPPGAIVAQVPPPGAPAVPSTRVHSLVSHGPRPPAWVMPDLTGLDRQHAERWLAANGLRRGAVRSLATVERRSGVVLGQQPLAGHPIRASDIVELTVAQ